MKKAILGKKLGMTQIFAEDGTLIPVTVIQAGPCSVVQKKTAEVDGYVAVQVGFEDKKEKNVNIISVALDAPQTVLNSLSGKLGMIDGVSSKLMITK